MTKLLEKEKILYFGKRKEIVSYPYLLEIQKNSYKWFKEVGLREAFEDVFPISDFAGKLDLEFVDYEIGEVNADPIYCKESDMTYSFPLRVNIRLIRKENNEIKDIKEHKVFMGDIPEMTPQGSFIINGAERVVVNQLVRSAGSYFLVKNTDKELFWGVIIPERGSWLEFELPNVENATLSIKIDKSRRIPVTLLLKALGLSTEEILKEFSKSSIIKRTLEKDGNIQTQEEALIELYKKLKPGELPTLESARTMFNNLFFDERRYNLSKVGRYKFNKRFNLPIICENCQKENKPGEFYCKYCGEELNYKTTLEKNDIILSIKHILKLYHREVESDDMDSLASRRVKSIGELLQNQIRIGLLRMSRIIQERMSVIDIENVTPQNLINIRPLVGAVKEFFGTGQLSQFMDQTNLLSELTNKRRLSALGPGGLTRERAGFEVRDVQKSHYGRICPIETPEGANIGLIGSLAIFAKVNKFGFIITPYRKVVNGKVTDEIVYLTADEEENYNIALAYPITEKGEIIDEDGNIINDNQRSVLVRAPKKNQYIDNTDLMYVTPLEVDFMDISTKQLLGISAALIPFIEHDDANRALMGANMQRQAVPFIKSEAPIVGTGIEGIAARDSESLKIAINDGIVTYVDAFRIIVKTKNNQTDVYKLLKFKKSNSGTLLHHKPIVKPGQKIKKGDVLADISSSSKGELAIGKNVRVAFMPWEGYNFEDAIIISEDLVINDTFTSIHIEEYEIEARETKLGPEEITRDVPNVSQEALKDLDEDGIIRIGADVGPEDILVGKITPKGESELSAEEKLLRAIFGEKAKDVRDSSLRMPHGAWGKVIDVKVFSRENMDELSPNVLKMVRVYVAQKRKISVGDKMSGRHGNKGVISIVVPREDMPYLADGTPVDIVLNPLGIPSRMNLGQLMETYLGLAAKMLNLRVKTPVFDGATEQDIKKLLKEGYKKEIQDLKINGYNLYDILLLYKRRIAASKEEIIKMVRPNLNKTELKNLLLQDLSEKEIEKILDKIIENYLLDGKVAIYDGRTGKPFENRVMYGYIYMLKLYHLVEDKIHARSTGPYSLVTQQPLGGKAQLGGQRFGEMEVWALEGYGAAHLLQEMLTIKSDDVTGRVTNYEAIVKGEPVKEPSVPESFKVLIKELQSLALNVNIITEDEKVVDIKTIENQLLQMEDLKFENINIKV